MKITKLTFSKKYPYAPYLNFDIGFEAEIGEGESPLEAIKQLEQMADNYHREKFPESYPIQEIPQGEQEPSTPESKEQSIIDQIKKSNEVTVIKSFELLAKNLGGKVMEAFLDKINTPVIDVVYDGIYRDGGTKEYKTADGTSYFIWINDRKVYKNDFPPTNTTPENVILNVAIK